VGISSDSNELVVRKADGSLLFIGKGRANESSGVAWGDITGKPPTFAPEPHSHDANDISTGILNDALIPELDMAKITTGTLDWSRLANVPDISGGGDGGASVENAIVYLGHMRETAEPSQEELTSFGAISADELFGDPELKTGYTIRDAEDRDWRYIAEGETVIVGGGSEGTPGTPDVTVPEERGWTGNTANGVTFNKVIYTGHNNLFVAIGNSGHISTSADGRAWASAAGLPAGIGDLRDIIYTGGYYIAVGASGAILISTDGVAWTKATLPSSASSYQFTSVASDGTNVLAVGQGTGFVVYTALSNINAWSVTGTIVGSQTNVDRFIAYSPDADIWFVANKRTANGQAMLYRVEPDGGGSWKGAAGAPAATGSSDAWSYSSYAGSASAIRFVNHNFWVVTSDPSGSSSSYTGRIFRLPPNASQNIRNDAVDNVTPAGSNASLWDIVPFGVTGVIAFGNNGKAYYTLDSAHVTSNTWNQLAVGDPATNAALRSGVLAGNDTANDTLVAVGAGVRYARYYIPSYVIPGEPGTPGTPGNEITVTDGYWYLVGGESAGGEGIPGPQGFSVVDMRLDNDGNLYYSIERAE